MGVTRRRRRDHRLQLRLSCATVTVLGLLFFATSAVCLNPTQPLRRELRVEGEKSRQQLKGLKNGLGSGRAEPTLSRLSGPGSSPPRCISKCGKCRPCKPVHVAIQPGLSMPLEYYPEAWRCKCGDKLFMP